MQSLVESPSHEIHSIDPLKVPEISILDDDDLRQVVGGAAPNGSWSTTLGPNGSW
jgi:hypothetical protein